MSQRKPERKVARRAIGMAGNLLMVAGLFLVGFYVAAQIHSIVMSRIALRNFLEMQQKKPVPAKPEAAPQPAKKKVDFSLWSTGRIAAYKRALSKEFAPPLAVLKIPRIGLEAPVFEGTDSLTLNRGAGWIEGTARPGQRGNIGIAGHRDGFFRGLKNIAVGDRIELLSAGGKEIYTVEKIHVVKPTDVQVLKDGSVPVLTLVTCYPFYFVGSAPLRYIIRAPLSHENPDRKATVQPDSTDEKIKNEEKTR